MKKFFLNFYPYFFLFICILIFLILYHIFSGYVPGRSAPVLYAYSKQVPDPNQALLKVPLLKRRDKTVVRVGLGDWIQFEAA